MVQLEQLRELQKVKRSFMEQAQATLDSTVRELQECVGHIGEIEAGVNSTLRHARATIRPGETIRLELRNLMQTGFRDETIILERAREKLDSLRVSMMRARTQYVSAVAEVNVLGEAVSVARRQSERMMDRYRQDVIEDLLSGRKREDI
ncbi:hypothetical protein WJ32_18550 (plasmid) [Burkholderia ubonensis]|uniref:Uncharacterized protein n=1 Tax=Burkholderia ubonensis TaxID=101571 RepID=A0A103RNS5_9BURK|nr:hypothetical protein [Burkholderia ubonensis]AOJ64580.1 hypothetical protein WJ32_18550 [Burkholderia ubonensis]KVG71124.1 hypothetical protein WJ33_21270 [Burkholderia ubonensis]